MRHENEKQAQKEMSIKFNTAYFLAKEELPFTKYAGLIRLQKKNGIEVSSTYANDTKCAEMTQTVTKLLADNFSCKLDNAHFSLLIDGASDVAGIENETIHCRRQLGVSAKLKVDVPHLVEIHRFLHRLELALLSMQRECQPVSNVYDVLHLVWKTYHYSPKSKHELKALGTELGIDVSQSSGVKVTRWLPHVSRALVNQADKGW